MCLRREGHDRRRAGDDAAQRSCRLAGLLPRVRRTSVRDSSQTDGQLSHQAEAVSGVAGAASRCRRGGRRTPGWTTCYSAARWPHQFCSAGNSARARSGQRDEQAPRADSVRGKRTSGRILSALLLRNDLGTLVGRYRRFCIVATPATGSPLPLLIAAATSQKLEPLGRPAARRLQIREAVGESRRVRSARAGM